ncbi:hypothetical protein ABB55_09100 [Prosthecomicrobium hirschii]|uniref:Uncharacterized protein n=1 Tax=Prosthecodimorpha hirschii TaxID=665126 RepID=A0A0P6VK05_9HYPH|nr:hypothetical protein [Prosthecomicrobium hirschii]KPL52368.1 hypothetical protein ABB55_09100 [Prosthecomicrobium hirschii]
MRAAATTLLLLSALAWPFGAGANTIAAPDSVAVPGSVAVRGTDAVPGRTPSAPAAVTETAERLACSGCGCRGGGGYRLPSGKCAPRR